MKLTRRKVIGMGIGATVVAGLGLTQYEIPMDDPFRQEALPSYTNKRLWIDMDPSLPSCQLQKDPNRVETDDLVNLYAYIRNEDFFRDHGVSLEGISVSYGNNTFAAGARALKEFCHAIERPDILDTVLDYGSTVAGDATGGEVAKVINEDADMVLSQGPATNISEVTDKQILTMWGHSSLYQKLGHPLEYLGTRLDFYNLRKDASGAKQAAAHNAITNWTSRVAVPLQTEHLAEVDNKYIRNLLESRLIGHNEQFDQSFIEGGVSVWDLFFTLALADGLRTSADQAVFSAETRKVSIGRSLFDGIFMPQVYDDAQGHEMTLVHSVDKEKYRALAVAALNGKLHEVIS